MNKNILLVSLTFFAVGICNANASSFAEDVYKKTGIIYKNVCNSEFAQTVRVPLGITALAVVYCNDRRSLKVPSNLKECMVPGTLFFALTLLKPELKSIVDEAKNRYRALVK